MTDNLVPIGFDYNQLDPGIRTDVEAAGRRIHELERRTSESIVEIGQHLIQVKQQLPHGAFQPWLNAEFGWSDRTARNFMQVAEVFGDKTEIISDFAPTALIALASPSTPDDIREGFEEFAKLGQPVRVIDVKKAIEDRKPKATQPIPVDDWHDEAVEAETAEVTTVDRRPTRTRGGPSATSSFETVMREMTARQFELARKSWCWSMKKMDPRDVARIFVRSYDTRKFIAETRAWLDMLEHELEEQEKREPIRIVTRNGRSA